MRCIRTLSLLLLPLLLVGLGSTLQLLEDGYPIMWTKASANLSLLPSVDKVLIINPWNYLQRMGLYRLLLSATEPYMTSMGPKDTDHPLWPHPIKLGWMHLSGRLVDPSGASECGTAKGDPMCISPLSWWGCFDYYMSVLPFMAAVEKGIIGNGFTKVQVQIPDVAEGDYCISHAECTLKHPEVMAKWEAFFQALKDISKSDLPEAEKKDKILGYMWDAIHTSRYIEVPAKCQNKEVYYPQAEMTYAKELIECMEYVALTNYHPNIDNIMIFMAPLPGRILQDTDDAPYIADFSLEENQSLYIHHWTLRVDRLLGGAILRMWKSAMCSEKSRVKAQESLVDMMINPDFNTAGYFTEMTKMIYDCFTNVAVFSPFLEHTEL